MCSARCLTAVALVLGSSAVAALPAAANPGANLGANGIGSVHFGLAKAEAVRELSSLFGKPTARGIDTGCGPRWTEVFYGDDLEAEFTGSTFTGYRYKAGIERDLGPPSVHPKAGTPRLATALGITLGSTLRQVRSHYQLHLSGAGRWHAGNLMFYSDAQRSPAPLSSRIFEIKTMSACGDY